MERLTRRDFFGHTLILGGASVLGVGVLGCGGGGELTCTDTSALTPGDLTVRQQLEYADRSPNPSQTCLNCRFFVAPQSADVCGSCSLVKGPINPKGHCKSWSAKA